MNSADWDNDVVVDRWCTQQREVAAEYMARQLVKFGQLGEWPAWHIAPYVAVWAVESLGAPGKVGWWVISGDLPTDYVSGADASNPRAAVSAFSKRWEEAAKQMELGEQPSEFTVGNIMDAPRLGPLLRARAQILTIWASDNSVWNDE